MNAGTDGSAAHFTHPQWKISNFSFFSPFFFSFLFSVFFFLSFTFFLLNIRDDSERCLVSCFGRSSFLPFIAGNNTPFCFPGCCAFRFCLLSSSPRRHDCFRDQSSDAGLSIYRYRRGFHQSTRETSAEESTLVSSVSGHFADMFFRMTLRESVVQVLLIFFFSF